MSLGSLAAAGAIDAGTEEALASSHLALGRARYEAPPHLPSENAAQQRGAPAPPSPRPRSPRRGLALCRAGRRARSGRRTVARMGAHKPSKHKAEREAAKRERAEERERERRAARDATEAAVPPAEPEGPRPTR